jgi:hypothetical protein
MCKRVVGRMRETKVTDTELNWLYSALIAKQPIDPSYLMINRWCCEATSGAGHIGSGCYLSMLAFSLRPGIARNPDHLLRGTSLSTLNICDKANTLVEMREEVFVWP